MSGAYVTLFTKNNSMSKVLIITDTVPNIYHGGGGVTSFSIIKSLINLGHKVDLIALSKNEFNYEGRNDDTYKEQLYNIGINKINILNNVSTKKVNIFRKFFPRLKDLFPGYLSGNLIQLFLNSEKHDIVFAYHWNALASIIKIKDVPKFGIVGDPIHLPYLFRKAHIKRYQSSKRNIIFFKLWLLELTQIPRKINIMKGLLNNCDQSGAFAYHHAFSFKNSGVINCNYFRTPVIDPLINFKNTRNIKANKFKILHIGHLQGIATISGIELLANDIIPKLNQLIGIDNYEVHLVGGYFDTLPLELQQKLICKNIIIRGQVTPSDNEFISSHILIVPTPIELGIRVRIITGLSFGNCIVTHSANQKGIPELVNNENCLIANNGLMLANACFLLYQNENLRKKLELNARNTYNEFFSPESAGNEISLVIEKLLKKN